MGELILHRLALVSQVYYCPRKSEIMKSRNHKITKYFLLCALCLCASVASAQTSVTGTFKPPTGQTPSAAGLQTRTINAVDVCGELDFVPYDAAGRKVIRLIYGAVTYFPQPVHAWVRCSDGALMNAGATAASINLIPNVNATPTGTVWRLTGKLWASSDGFVPETRYEENKSVPDQASVGWGTLAPAVLTTPVVSYQLQTQGQVTDWETWSVKAAADVTNPASNNVRPFFDSSDSNKMKRRNSDGTLTTIEGGGGGGAGTVTSVALSAPVQFSVSGSPVTTAGTLGLAWVNQNANLIFAGPASGGAAAPAFRSLVALDIPALDAAKVTTGIFSTARLGSGTPGAGNYLRGDGAWTTPSFAELSGAATDAQVPNNITIDLAAAATALAANGANCSAGSAPQGVDAAGAVESCTAFLRIAGDTLTGTLVPRAGATGAGTAPIKFQAGSVMTAPEAHAFEWDGANLFVTQATGPTRKTLAFLDSNITGNAANVTGTVAIANGGTGQTSALAAFNALSPLTARGDLLTRDATNNVRLGIGAAGRFVRSDGTDPSWALLAAGDLPTGFVDAVGDLNNSLCVDTEILKKSGGSWVCAADATGGSPTWNSIANPAGAQALTMGANNTTWTWDSLSGVFKSDHTSAFTAGTQFAIRQLTGNPTGGTLFGLVVNDPDVTPFTVNDGTSDVISLLRSGVINVSTGLRIAGAATSGNVLRGNGTNFVSAQLAFSDLSGSATDAQIPDTATINVGGALSGTAAVAELVAAVTGSGIELDTSSTPDRLQTASNEQNFLKSGALTCGASTQGKMQVHTTPLQYCDNAGTPALQYAAYGNSAGAASSGVTASGFFPAGTLEDARLSANVVLKNQANAWSTGLQDFGAATVLLPNAATLPGTCTLGEIFVDNNETPAGQQVYVCSSTNVFSKIGDGGGGGFTSFTVAGDGGSNQTITDANTLTIAGTTGIVTAGAATDILNVSLDYADTLAGNPTFAAKECVFVTEGSSGGGFLCEGSTGSNTNEQLYLFPAVDGADTTTFIVVNAAQVTAIDGTGLSVGSGTLNCDAASQTVVGCAEIATAAEVITGTDDTRAISPLALAGTTVTRDFPLTCTNPRVKSLAGNAFFDVVPLATADIDITVAKFLDAVDGRITCTGIVPNELAGTPAAKFLFHVAPLVACGASQNFRVNVRYQFFGAESFDAALTAETAQDIVGSTTANVSVLGTFPSSGSLASAPAAGEVVYVEIQGDRNHANDNCAQVMQIPVGSVKLRVDVKVKN
jgi:hypothetical protein